MTTTAPTLLKTLADLSSWTFSVIYSCDFPPPPFPYENIYPPHWRKRSIWTITESGPSDYATEYSFDTAFKGWRHRKFCAELTLPQLIDFLWHSRFSSTCQTMGSLGAPGHGMGWAPAVSFNCSDADCDYQAYVTPNPPPPPPPSPTPPLPPLTEEDLQPQYSWDNIEEILLGCLGDVDDLHTSLCSDRNAVWATPRKSR